MHRKFSRTQLLHFTANVGFDLIRMEACGGSHFFGRALREQGPEVRLIPAEYVKPFVKSNKNDFVDAEAIAEAVRIDCDRKFGTKSHPDSSLRFRIS